MPVAVSLAGEGAARTAEVAVSAIADSAAASNARRIMSSPRFLGFDVFRTHAQADQARQQARKEWNAARQRGSQTDQRRSFIREDAADDVCGNEYLQRLRGLSRKLATALHAA